MGRELWGPYLPGTTLSLCARHPPQHLIYMVSPWRQAFLSFPFTDEETNVEIKNLFKVRYLVPIRTHI